MRRRFFIKIDEEIVTTITILRFSPYFFESLSACDLHAFGQLMEIIPRPNLQGLDIFHEP